jgi:hypothetical protein
MVAAHADACAGVNGGATLADEDIAGNDGLATEFLDAEAAAGRITAVAR